ncbi:MAG: hypothetical protein E7047_00155 [Lentisphaerae bacterium]|nr:hypothetical protein [Lentisphaerota bacterium]
MKIFNKKLFTLLGAACGLTFAASAAEVPFQLLTNDTIQVLWHGNPLVISERFSCLQQDGFAGSEQRLEKIGEHRVLNHFGKVDNMAYRREAVLKNGGKEVEISFQVNVPAYNTKTINQAQSYAIYLDYKDFANWRYTALTGRIHQTSIQKGVLQPNAPDGNIFAGSIRQVVLESPDGKRSLVIDCSPGGVNDFYSDYPPNGIMSLWGFQKIQGQLCIYVGYRPQFYGGSNTGKVQIYEGRAEDYAQRHAHRHYPYFSELDPDRLYALAADNVGKRYTKLHLQKFTPQQAAGWLNIDGIQRRQQHTSGAAYSALYGSGKHTFRMSNLRSGVHLLTFIAPAYEDAVNDMNIAVNGKSMVKNLNLPPQTLTHITLPVWIENGTADIELSGNWQLSTVGDQILQTSAEDFSFRRGFWVSHAGPHPAVMFQSGHYLTEPEFKVSISSYPLPIPGQEMQQPRKDLTYTTAHAEFAPGRDWRNGAMIGGWGPSNNGSFDEFSAPGAIEKRLDELQNDKVDTVILNGLLSRHTYIHHIDRVEKAVAQIVKAGHQRNMHFIDHWDFSELWNCDSGFRLMTERMDQLQQMVSTGLPARGLCPTNPITRQVFYDSVVRHVKATDIDGLMIDESCFHGIEFCGCAHCRIAFTRDTNWQLPVDETSPELFNKNSPLWQAWLAWRMKAIGDFQVGLRQAVRQVKPDLVFIGYTTHYGMYSNYATVRLGGSLEQFCRAWDFPGTEIMSRNGFASYRSVMCFRKMKNMVKNVYGLPVFGLVYSDVNDWDVMYFGWALNNLNAQTTWDGGSPCPEGKPNYRRFTVENGNMNFATVASKAEIALYFSNYSRDIDKSASAHVDVMGFSQVMTANHIPHEFIFEAGLTPEILSRYKVLFINNATAIREKDVLAIRDYVRNGGIVYISNFGGFYNDIAQKHNEWPVGKYLLNGSKYDRSDQSKFHAISWNSGKKVKLSKSAYYLPYKLAPELEVIARFENGSKTGTPGLVCNQIGKGKVYFCPTAFGAYAAAFEASSRSKMNFEANEEMEAVILDMIKTVAGEHFVWQTENVPSQVLTSLYQDKSGKILAHFLNATKSNYRKGEMIPSRPPANCFEALEQEMSFTIQHPGTRAYAASPEFDKFIELPVKRNKGKLTVTIPGGTLKGYMVVHVE